MSKTQYMSGTYEVFQDDQNDPPQGYYARIEMDSGWQVPDCPLNFDTEAEASYWARSVIETRDTYERVMASLGVVE